jgi:PAS domain S-box-containing protein
MQRVKTENSISTRDSVDYFHLFTESALVGIYIIQEGKFKYVNPALARIFDYRRDELIDRLGPLDLTDPSSHPLVKQNIRKRIKGEVDKIHYTFKGRRKDGSTIDCEVLGFRIEYKGKPAILGMLLDITEKKRAEENVLKKEKELEALFKTTTYLNAESDLDRILERIADAINEVIGFSLCSIRLVDKERNALVTKVVRGVGKEYFKYRKFIPIGKNSYDISGLAVVTGKPHYVKDIIELDFPEEVKENVIKKFNLKSYLSIPIKVKDEILGVISIMTKEEREFSTDEIRLLSTFAEQAGQAILRARLFSILRESEERYRTMVETANDLIWTLDREGRFTYVNKRAEELSGYKFEEWKGRNFVPLIVPEDLPKVEKVFRETLKGKPQSYEVRVYKKDGGILVLSVNTAPIYKNGEVVGTVSFGRDITEQRALEAKLSTIYKVANEMALCKSVEEIINTGLDAVLEIMKLKNVYLFLVDEKRNELYVKAYRGIKEDIRLSLDSDRGVTVWVAKTRKPLIVPDVRKEPKYVEGKHKMLSEMAVPLIVKDRVIGVLDVESEKLDAFKGDDLKLLQVLASGMAIALENAQLVKRIKNSEELYKSLFEFNKSILENSPIGVVKLDNFLRIEYINQEMRKILSLTSRNLRGKKLEELKFFKDTPITEIFGELKSGREVKREIPFSSDSKDMYFSLRGVPIFEDEKFSGAIILLMDITERKQMEKALRESEERYRTLARSANDAIVWMNAKGEITMWNNAAEKLFGYKEKEVLGKNPHHLLVPKEYKNRFEKGMRRFSIYGNGAAVNKPIEVTAIRKDGSKIPVEISISPVKTRDGWEAIAIIRDISERKVAEMKLRESFERLRKTVDGAVQAMARIVEMRDPYTAGHQRRVTQLACAIAKEMGLGEEEIEGLRIAANLHDIGKIHIPAEILSKPGRLTGEEMSIVKTHPQVGYEILKNIEFGRPIALYVLQHHERLNGSGYPLGLKGDEILLGARIIGVADVVEAMASHRPYRPALGIDMALKEIENNKGILYDPEVVDTCIKLFREKGFDWEEWC